LARTKDFKRSRSELGAGFWAGKESGWTRGRWGKGEEKQEGDGAVGVGAM